MSQALEDFVARYFERNHYAIKKICEPLQLAFGINSFTYNSISHDGKIFGLNNRPDWSLYHAAHDLFLTDPFWHHPRCYQNGAVLWSNLRLEAEASDSLQVAKEKYNIAHGLTLIVPHRDRCEFFMFNAPPSHLEIGSIYLNELIWLKQFCQYFKKELKHLIKQVEHNPIDLLELKGKAFLEEKQSPFPALCTDKSLFIKTISHEQPIKLTRREKECLNSYLEFKNMQEVADQLKLSIRTVEFYLSNVKSKLDCANKIELYLKGQELRSRGLL